ncbi:hypothetical protein M422DRAFT_164849 [Sphaerobolus stellatus SS14]|uniref:Unplaced genomic scaffold SPHSTscaffold_31, whole genome shotgun sequence n=1 Tax=Sphaerobolus stellatus (strain SS14) TaxID=990650 RepID=A0A0C9VHA9_SPHS4|nr:hypothetical protein M422DRAFT_164849 [Sphaerobolus stellatus SS14]
MKLRNSVELVILAAEPQDDLSDCFQEAPDPELTSEDIQLRSRAVEWINPLDDEEDEVEQQPIYQVVQRLIKDAQRFKSFSSLMHLHSVKAFLELREKYRLAPRIKNPAMRASQVIAKSIGKGPYFAKKLRSLTRYIGRFRTLPPPTAGKHNAHPSLLNNERIAQAVRRYLTVLADGEITPLKLLRQVNNVIIPALGLDLAGQKISESCARRWLVKLGYEMKEVKKGMYVDGHERADVLLGYLDFGSYFDLILISLRRIYKDKDLEPIEPTLAVGEKLHIPVFHDESICRSNDLRRRVWVREGRMPLRKKGEGRAIHISDFIVEQTGRIILNEEQRKLNEQLPVDQRLAVTDARKIIYPGKNSDGWWNMEKLIMKRTLPIFERLYPGAVGEFFFDQSSAHGAFAPDALNAKEMNVKPGGKQRMMHPTFIPMDNPNPALRGQPQSMSFPAELPPCHPHYEFRGKPKGMRQVIEERGLLDYLTSVNGGKVPPGECKFCKASREKQEQLMREAQAIVDEPDETREDIPQLGTSIACCMRRFLSEQEDFKAEKPLLQIVIEEAGHKCYFLPKFHCELNPIEMYWGWTKTRLRVAADGTFPTAKRLVPDILDSCPTKTIRAFFRKTWRYMDAYRKGLNAKEAEYAIKKYRSHRAIGRNVMMSLEIMHNPA